MLDDRFHARRDLARHRLRRPDHAFPDTQRAAASFEDRAGPLAMAALSWCAARLLGGAARLFYLGLLSRRRTTALITFAVRLDRAALTLLRRRFRRRRDARRNGDDGHDDRT